MFRNKYLGWLVLSAALGGAVLFSLYGNIFLEGRRIKIDSGTKDDFPEQPIIEIQKENKKIEEEKTVTILPSKAGVAVPFLSQAPFGKWDALHEDACEEASLIMLKFLADRKESISKEIGEKEIQGLVQYQEKNGYGISVTVLELSRVAKDYYGLNLKPKYNVSIEDIKREISSGRPVIVPAAGKILDNPNFRNGGPIYHMLVIKGYDEKGFITNDPGTRLGENFRYTFENLYSSIHDWNAKDILKGQKAYLVTE